MSKKKNVQGLTGLLKRQKSKPFLPPENTKEKGEGVEKKAPVSKKPPLPTKSIRIPKELHGRIKRSALKQNMLMTELIEKVLEETGLFKEEG